MELALHGHVRSTDDDYPLVSSDAPTWVRDGIQFNDTETAFLDFNIPQDYDTARDICALRLKLMPAAATAYTTDMGVTTAQALYRAGATVDNTVRSAVAEDATASTGALVREIILDLSGSEYEPGDRIRLTLTASNEDSTELILLGIDLLWFGGLAAYNDDDRFLDIG